tara:strand:- start:2955 stop:3152 length:198 start_codon:yes stop_codon:yes gene_type:complete
MRKFKYNGIRVKDRGEVRGFSDEKLTPEKLQRLKDKGWEEIIEKSKPKPKPKPKPKAKKKAKKKK